MPKDFKPSNYQYKQLLHNNYYVQNSNILKPKSAYPRKNNFINNSNNVNNINQNVVKPNVLGINSNFPSNKAYMLLIYSKKFRKDAYSFILHLRNK